MSKLICRTCGRVYSNGERFCTVDGTPLVGSYDGWRAVATEETDPLVGTLVGGRYRLRRRLGAGGSSIVYLAEREPEGGRVAVKFLKEEVAARLGSVERFIVEARASSRLEHPNIVSAFDFGREPSGRYYLVMEYVDGRSLIRLIRATRGLGQTRTVRILSQLLSALRAAHGEGIVHRDLKPENVLCTRHRDTEDFVKILDFGLAKFMDDQTEPRGPEGKKLVIGTPYYMSPEQARGEPVDGRTDLYSVGVMAYEMLTGRVPFRGENAREVLIQHATMPPKAIAAIRPDLRIDPDLEAFVMRLLEKKPEQRFQRASEALEVLSALARRLEQVERQVATGLSVTETVESHFAGKDTATTIWEVPGLLADSERLTVLWRERLREAADRVWGPGRWPQEVINLAEEAERFESKVGEAERAMAPLRAEIDAIEVDVREREGALRFERLDLVAQRCVLTEALQGTLETTGDGSWRELVTRLGIPEELLRRRDPVALRRAISEVDKALERVDERARVRRRTARAEIRRLQGAIHGHLRRISRLRSEQGARIERLLTILRESARGRNDLAPVIASVAEVAGAMEIFRAALRSVRPTNN